MMPSYDKGGYRPLSPLDYRLGHVIEALMAAKLGIITNPISSAIRLLLRGQATVRFDGGLALRVSWRKLGLLRAIVELSYPHGVVFAGTASPDSHAWILDQDRGTVLLPNGVRLTIDSLRDAIVPAETFIYDVHAPGMPLEGELVVDVGANVGDTALYYASLGATVHAYEPDPENFDRMKQNLELNPILGGRVHAHRSAVGPDATVEFHSGLRGASSRYARGGRPIKVSSVSLRTILAQDLEGQPPALLKIDAKGAEAEILSQPEVARFRAVLVEYDRSYSGPSGPAELGQTLRSNGFRVSRLYKHNSGFHRLACVGMIEARK